MNRIYRIIQAAFHAPGTSLYSVVGAVIWLLIVASLASLAAESLLPPDSFVRAHLKVIDRSFLIIFAIEIVLRVVSYEPPDLRVFERPPLGRMRVHILGRLRYLAQPLMFIDLIAVASLLPELRSLRVLRLLRLLRTVQIFRYGNPFSGLFHAFSRDRLLFGMAFAFLFVQVVIGGLTLFLVEIGKNPEITSLADAIWYALVTLTTVGYGDITPVTAMGRVVSGVLMVGGMFSLAMFAGIVSHSLLHAVLSVREEQFRMGDHADHIVVCGYEDGMNLLLDALVKEYDPEKSKIVVFADADRPADIPPEMYWIRGDSTKESELDKVRVGRASAVLVAGARHTSPQQADAVTLLTLFTLRSYLKRQRTAARRKKPVYIVAEILDSENVMHARAAGADEVIETRRLGFSLLAHAIEQHGTADTLSQVVLGGTNTLYAGVLPEELHGRKFGELTVALGMRARNGLVIGVTNDRTGEDFVNPEDDLTLTSDMKVLYLAAERILD